MKNFKWFLFLSGVITLGVGLYMFAFPTSTLISLSYIFSAVLLFTGISEVIHYCSKENQQNKIYLISGLITIVLAVSLFSSSWFELMVFIPYLLSFWILNKAITKMFLAWYVRPWDKKESNTLFFFGFLGSVLALFLLARPVFTGFMLAYIVGLGFVYQGLMYLFNFYKLNKYNS